MRESDHLRWTRRGFLGAVSAALVSSPLINAAEIWEQGPADQTAGGSQAQPNWDTQLTITVGRHNADLVGENEKVIQAAVDYIAGWGGGTVHILPGTYRMRNSVSLRSGVRILGSGQDSILMKEPEVKSKLAEDSDVWQREVVLADPNGFQVGDGVCLQVIDEWHRGNYFIQRSLVARNGNRFKLDRPLDTDDFTVRGKATIATLFPLFNVNGVSDVWIGNIALDGNKANQESLFHNWGNILGGIWLNKSNRVQIKKVISRHSCADGISAQTCNDFSIEDSYCHDNVGFGIHSGTGSQRPIVRNNRLEKNYIGFYFCWGSRHGLVENNLITDSRRYGVRLGQKDTDNVVRGNEIRRSGEVGVMFQEVDGGRAYSPDRNRIEDNKIVDSGGKDGIAVDVCGIANAITISGNNILETRQPLDRIGIRIGPHTGKVDLTGNKIKGFAENITDLRRS
ncbi:MAG: right-handed parallel beta-helix repeat-containing protein [Acetobacteraceae bacterium]